MTFAGSVHAGRLGDRLGHRDGLLALHVLRAAGFVCLAAVGDLAVTLAVLGAIGLADHAAASMTQSLAGELAGEEGRLALMGRLRVVTNTVLAVLLQTRVSRAMRTYERAARAVRLSGLLLAACCVCLAASVLGGRDVSTAFLFAAVVCLTLAEMLKVAAAWQITYTLAPPGRSAEFFATYGLGGVAGDRWAGARHLGRARARQRGLAGARDRLRARRRDRTTGHAAGAGAAGCAPPASGPPGPLGPSRHLRGSHGLKKGLRGRFANDVPPVLAKLVRAEVEHNPRNNRVRAL